MQKLLNTMKRLRTINKDCNQEYPILLGNYALIIETNGYERAHVVEKELKISIVSGISKYIQIIS